MSASDRSAINAPTDVALDMDVDLGSLYALRAAVSAHADDLGMAEERLGKLLLIANELATNAIRHAGGTARLRLWRAGGAVYCQVTDEGPGLSDPDGAGMVAVPLNATGGRGLWIVRRLSDEVVIAAADVGTSVTAVMHG